VTKERLFFVDASAVAVTGIALLNAACAALAELNAFCPDARVACAPA